MKNNTFQQTLPCGVSERLEDIKVLEEALKYQDRDNGDWFIQIDYDSFKFLREQAERVQYLEETKAQALRINQKEMRCRWDISSQLADSERENKRYRKALEDIRFIQDHRRTKVDYEVLAIVDEALEDTQ